MPVFCQFCYLILCRCSQSQFPYHLAPDQPNLHNTNSCILTFDNSDIHHTHRPLALTFATLIVLKTSPLPSSHHQSTFTTMTTLFFHITTVRVTLQLHHFPPGPNLHQSHNPNDTNGLHCHQPPHCDFPPSTTHFNRIDTQHTGV